MVDSSTRTYYSIDMEANELGSLQVTSSDGATDENMLALAEAINTWKTNYPTNIQIDITKITENYNSYITDLSATPPAFD